MPIGKESDRSLGPTEFDNVLKEIVSSRKEFRMSKIVRFMGDNGLGVGDPVEGFSKEDDDGESVTETNVENCVIIGFTEIAKGKGTILALHEDQIRVVEHIYDVDFDCDVKYFATIENAANKDVVVKSAQIKRLILNDSPANNLIISEPLARALNVENGQEIKITGVQRQKTSEIDLDKIYPVD